MYLSRFGDKKVAIVLKLPLAALLTISGAMPKPIEEQLSPIGQLDR